MYQNLIASVVHPCGQRDTVTRGRAEMAARARQARASMAVAGGR
jgi:hypothetical protein